METQKYMVKKRHFGFCFVALAWFLGVFAVGLPASGAVERTAQASKTDDVAPTGNELMRYRIFGRWMGLWGRSTWFQYATGACCGLARWLIRSVNLVAWTGDEISLKSMHLEVGARFSITGKHPSRDQARFI